jgi:type IV pilus assembly protein PilQ
VNIGKLPSNFYLNLKALEQKGVANIRSRPLLATLNGTPASLSIGTTQYFLLNTTTPYRDQTQLYLQQSQNFQSIDADVKLDITPYVGSDGQITVEIKPDFKTPVGTFSADVPPTINKRSMSSTLIMREGETIVLGGLIQESETETRTQTPILGSIPLLGYLFSHTTKSKDKSELIIYVTPHISYGEEFKTVSLPSQEE